MRAQAFLEERVTLLMTSHGRARAVETTVGLLSFRPRARARRLRRLRRPYFHAGRRRRRRRVESRPPRRLESEPRRTDDERVRRRDAPPGRTSMATASARTCPANPDNCGGCGAACTGMTHCRRAGRASSPAAIRGSSPATAIARHRRPRPTAVAARPAARGKSARSSSARPACAAGLTSCGGACSDPSNRSVQLRLVRHGVLRRHELRERPVRSVLPFRAG